MTKRGRATSRSAGSCPRADERHLILLRYGESDWNRENRFTGGTDVDLSTAGIAEAHTAARLLREAGLAFYVAFTSVLKQAIRTLWIVQDDLDRMSGAGPPQPRLNERHYGALQELNTAETAARFGEEQVHRWRRSYGVRPPPLLADDPRWPRDDPRYAALGDLDVVTADGSERTTIDEEAPFIGRFAYSPDGAQVAYESTSEDGQVIVVAPVTELSWKPIGTSTHPPRPAGWRSD